MPRISGRARALALPLCAAIPICIAIALNALVRPALADAAGGTRMQTATNHRSFDGWWEFDAAARAAHPALTRFLELSDGAVAAAGLVAAAACCAVLLLAERARRRGNQR